tara:strand:- start:2915 stop:4162 length:1248 start_codon:yes stop_codon:yes gene_type:complete
MSYSNGAVKTQYIDTTTFVPNQRCSFEINVKSLALLPNMRLLNLGCDNDTGATPYSQGVGAVSLIRNIRLMDARTEISGMRNVTPYAFFKNMNRSNEINTSQDSYFKRNRLGYEVNGLNNKIGHLYEVGDSNTAASGATATSYLDLRELLPALKSLPLLPTGVFSNLRLEIEFESRVSQQILLKDNVVPTILRPILAIDYVDDPNVIKPMMNMLMAGVDWHEIEWDNFQIPAQGSATGTVKTQSKTNSSMGFRGKTLKRLLIQKQLVDRTPTVSAQTVLGFGGVASSQALLQEALQINLNGKTVFPGVNGVNRPNAMLGVVVDAYDELQSYPGSNLYKWSKQAELNTDANFGGQNAWSCCEIGAQVADLQVTLSRQNVYDTDALNPTNAALQINLYGEVHKAITFNDGSYAITYV